MERVFYMKYLRSLSIPIIISSLPLILLFTDFRKEYTLTIVGYTLFLMLLVNSRKIGKLSLENDLQSGNIEYLLTSPMSIMKFLLIKSFWGALVLVLLIITSILITKQNFDFITIYHFGEIESLTLPLLMYFDGIFLSIIPSKQQSYFFAGRMFFMFLFYSYIFSCLSQYYETSWTMQNYSELTHVIFYSMIIVEILNILGALAGFLSTVFKLDIRYNITFKKFIITSYSVYFLFTMVIAFFHFS